MNKQIEEMAKIIADKMCYAFIDGRCSLNGSACDLICRQGDEYKECAKELCNAGYGKKVNDDEIVISKEEYENLQTAKDFDYGYHEGEANMTAYYENIKLPETRKETAREILSWAERVAKPTYYNVDDNPRMESLVLLSDICNFVKEKFGVEVE